MKILSSPALRKAREKHKNKDDKDNYSRIFLSHVCDFSRAITFLTITFNYLLYISIVIFVITNVSDLDIRFPRLLDDFLSL